METLTDTHDRYNAGPPDWRRRETCIPNDFFEFYS